MRPSCPPKVGLESKKKIQKPTKDKRQKTKDKNQQKTFFYAKDICFTQKN
jgi:hypothetical protein